MSHLDFVNQIGLCKYSTAGSNRSRIFASESDFSKFLYFHTKTACLAGKERTGSGCT